MRMKDKVALIQRRGERHGSGDRTAVGREGAAMVFVADLLDKEGAEVVDSINKAGGKARYLHLDVTDEAGWQAAIAEIEKSAGGLDVLVNNAGISGSAEQDLYDTAAWNRLMNINATGVFLGMKHGIALMKKRGKGSVINLSSVSGIVGQGFIHVGYNASKGAVRLITKSGAAQHGRDNIRVNSVHPGLMPPMRTSGRTADPATRAKTLKGVPLGRAGEVDEVAYAILFLASDNRPTSPARSWSSTVAGQPSKAALQRIAVVVPPAEWLNGILRAYHDLYRQALTDLGVATIEVPLQAVVPYDAGRMADLLSDLRAFRPQAAMSLSIGAWLMACRLPAGRDGWSPNLFTDVLDIPAICIWEARRRISQPTFWIFRVPARPRWRHRQRRGLACSLRCGASCTIRG